MSFAAGRPVLAIPGPSPVPDRVLRAMHRPSPDIYGGELTGLNLRVMADLKRLAGTVQHVAPYIGNGHAVWEAAIANLFAPGDAVLVLTTGHFGTGWAATARQMGVAVETLAVFIRFWLATTSSLPEPAAQAARAKAAERYEAFVAALGRRLAKGPKLLQEVSEDIAGTSPDEPA